MSTYLYGLVAGNHPQNLDGCEGVGSPPAALRCVAAGELVAVVSDAPASLRAKRRDVLAHELVLERLCEQGATLPMQFGIVAEDDAAVAEEIARSEARYLGLLAELEDRVEINVKASHHENAVLQRVLLDNDQLRKRNERMRAEGGGSYDERVRFGEDVSRAIEARETRDANAITAELEPLAVRQRAGRGVGGSFLNVSFLVQRRDVEEFEAAVEQVRSSWEELAEVRARGPLPPYSFTDPAQVGTTRIG